MEIFLHVCKKPKFPSIIYKSNARILFLLITTLIKNHDHANALDVVAALLCVFLVEWGPDFAKEII